MKLKSHHNPIQTIMITAVALISICGLLTGCSTSNSNPADPLPTDQTTATQGNTSTNEPPASSTGTNAGQQAATEEYLPEGVQVKRVLVDKSTHNFHKKVELLTDGGKRTIITNSDGNITMQNIEYDGVILSANGREVTVQVENGDQKTITIPEDAYIEDNDVVGLNKGVEIEWTVDQQGHIESVELDQ